jgi:hypothetical protein
MEDVYVRSILARSSVVTAKVLRCVATEARLRLERGGALLALVRITNEHTKSLRTDISDAVSPAGRSTHRLESSDLVLARGDVVHDKSSLSPSSIFVTEQFSSRYVSTFFYR